LVDPPFSDKTKHNHLVSNFWWSAHFGFPFFHCLGGWGFTFFRRMGLHLHFSSVLSVETFRFFPLRCLFFLCVVADLCLKIDVSTLWSRMRANPNFSPPFRPVPPGRQKTPPEAPLPPLPPFRVFSQTPHLFLRSLRLPQWFKRLPSAQPLVHSLWRILLPCNSLLCRRQIFARFRD